MFWDADIDHIDIEVIFSNGRVFLIGSVDAYWKKWEAEKKVFGAYGITAIDNQISIVPTESFLEKVIAKNIVDALKRNLYIDADDVVVKVEEVAAFTDGVVDVINKLSAA